MAEIGTNCSTKATYFGTGSDQLQHLSQCHDEVPDYDDGVLLGISGHRLIS